MRDLSVILGRIEWRAEQIVNRGSSIRHDPDLKVRQILASADDAEAILVLVEEAKAEVLEQQLKASLANTPTTPRP